MEQAEAIFPKNNSVKKLREKINCVNEGVAFEEIKPEDDCQEELNGNGAHDDSDDNSAFWYFALLCYLFPLRRVSYILSSCFKGLPQLEEAQVS